MTTTDPAERAIAYAAERGTKDGTNAAEWYLQDALRSTRDGVAIRRILQGIEDGDPAVLDTFPSADLSGQWADSLTGPILTEDALRAAGMTGRQILDMADYGDTLTAICDAYENAYSDAVSAEIERAARYQTGGEE